MDLRQEHRDSRQQVGAAVEVILPSHASEIQHTDIAGGAPLRSSLRAARSGLYVLLILAVALAAGVYSLRVYGIFSCQASGYGSDAYLGYCGATSYGDYDHGAIWFNLEPATNTRAASARVLFLGNSRTQFAFSSDATAEWFSTLSQSYYLLGFSHFENYTFELPLLRKLHPKAKLYIINIDSFFEKTATGPGKTAMQDPSARSRYQEKRGWQTIHKAVCTALNPVCGHAEAIFRSRSTGAWTVTGDRFKSAPVSYDETIDHDKVASYTALGKDLLPVVTRDHACMILTVVPTGKTGMATGRAIAAALQLNLIAPRLDGLTTFDEVHLDRPSAERWSSAFFEQAGPQIRKCLSE